MMNRVFRAENAKIIVNDIKFFFDDNALVLDMNIDLNVDGFTFKRNIKTY